jgi:hypothetical protein|tara:strand:- start:1429 stop:1707 length:279 start_codon:yes stop_codon:yes gene_type:complete
MGKKKNKVVDLKPEGISEDQLKELQKIVSTINKLKFDIGNMEAQKYSAVNALFEGNDRLLTMQTEFENQYGTNDINIQTGVINYSKDESSDS